MGSLKQSMAEAGINIDAINVSLDGSLSQSWNPYSNGRQPMANEQAHPGLAWAYGASEPGDGRSVDNSNRRLTSHGFDYLV